MKLMSEIKNQAQASHEPVLFQFSRKPQFITQGVDVSLIGKDVSLIAIISVINNATLYEPRCKVTNNF